MFDTTFLAGLLDGACPNATLSLVDWEIVLAELRAERLTPFVYAQLRRSPAWRDLPPAVQRALSEDFQTHSLRTFEMETELAGVLAALHADGVPVLLLKGAALGRSVYGSPAERPKSDVDLLIPAGDQARACQALVQRGYQAQRLLLLARWQTRYRSQQRLVRPASAERWFVVELHWSLFELPYYIDLIPMSEIWQTATATADLPGALLPDPATLLLHSCAHLALHHSQDMRLLWLLDVDRLLRQDSLDWDAVLARAARWHLRLALRHVVQQTQARLGTPLSAAVQAALDTLAPAPVEQAMWGLGDDRPGRRWRRVRASWAAMSGRQRWRYAGWLGVSMLVAYPETLLVSRR